MKIKLPKQWINWVQSAGLKPVYGRGMKNYFSLKGKGRFWRISCHGNFECSCPKSDFDRWANSFYSKLEGIPTTKSEFLAAVKILRF